MNLRTKRRALTVITEFAPDSPYRHVATSPNQPEPEDEASDRTSHCIYLAAWTSTPRKGSSPTAVSPCSAPFPHHMDPEQPETQKHIKINLIHTQ